jgi:F420H(2)-dependent biliverdin reductase
VPRARDFNTDLTTFWREKHLCTVTTLRGDGSPHVVPMGIVVDIESRIAWGITSRTSRKVANLRANPMIAVCQVDGRRWSTLEGRAQVREGSEDVAEAVRRYAERYRTPRPNDERVAIRIELTSVIGNV